MSRLEELQKDIASLTDYIIDVRVNICAVAESAELSDAEKLQVFDAMAQRFRQQDTSGALEREQEKRNGG